MINFSLIKISTDINFFSKDYTLFVDSSFINLTSVYYSIHRERYGVNEIIMQTMFTNADQKFAFTFNKKLLKDYGDWTLTIRGYHQQIKYDQISVIIKRIF